MIQYFVFSTDSTSRVIMKKIEKILDTNQKDTLMTSHPIEAVFSNHLEKIESKEDTNTKPKLIQEMRTLTEPAVEFRRDMFFVVLIASTAALIGLFANNPSIIIGAMLIAPLLKPITAFSFNVSVFNVQKIKTAGFSLCLLVGSVIGISAILTLITLQIVPLELTDEIQLRAETSPTFMILAIVLGMAGTLAMSSNIPGILVGVAIAAALVPPAVVMGIGLAMLDTDVLFGAGVLTLSNIIGLLLGTLSIFLIVGVTPKHYHKKSKINLQYIIFIVCILIGASALAFFLSF